MRYRRSSVKTKSLLGNIFARKERMVTFIQPNDSMVTSILYIYKTHHCELQGLRICMGSQFRIHNIVLSCTFTGRNEVVAKVMFLLVSVVLLGGGGGGCYPSMYCRWYPSMPCRFPGPHPRGSLGGSVRGVSRSTTKGEVEGDQVQAHSQGGS